MRQKSKFFLSTGLCLAMMASAWTAMACTTVLITPGAMQDGSSVVSHANDCGSCGWQIEKVEAKDHEPGSMYEILTLPQYTDGYGRWENCLEPTGNFIPQVEHTYGYIWGHFGYLNENQVAIGETSISSRRENSNANGFFEVTHLTVLAMERATSAREAIQIIGDLATTYGYYDGGEQLSIADPNEVWMFEIVGPGPLWMQGDGTPGALWVAQRVPDGHAAFAANASIIQEIDWDDTENFMYSDGIKEFVEEYGWWSEDSGREFNWKLDMCNTTTSRNYNYSARRIWSAYRYVVSPEVHETLVIEDLPFSLPVEKKITISDVFDIHRDMYEGTQFDGSNELTAGMFNNPRRPEGSYKYDGTTYNWSRLISSPRTEQTCIVQVRSGLPNEIGGILWYGANSAATTCFVPFYIGVNEITPSLNTESGSHWDFRFDSLWWAIASVNTIADLRWSLMIPTINEYQEKYETSVVNSIAAIDKAAVELYNKDPELAREFLTSYCNNNAETVRDAWWDLLFRLIQENAMGKVYDLENKTITNFAPSQEWVDKMMEVSGKTDVWW